MGKNELLAAKLLYKFLKKKRVLKAYIDNVMKQHRYNEDFIKLYEKGDILGIIDLCDSSFYRSFILNKTKEGVLYWHDIENEFILFFKKQF